MILWQERRVIRFKGGTFLKMCWVGVLLPHLFQTFFSRFDDCLELQFEFKINAEIYSKSVFVGLTVQSQAVPEGKDKASYQLLGGSRIPFNKSDLPQTTWGFLFFRKRQGNHIAVLSPHKGEAGNGSGLGQVCFLEEGMIWCLSRSTFEDLNSEAGGSFRWESLVWEAPDLFKAEADILMLLAHMSF